MMNKLFLFTVITFFAFICKAQQYPEMIFVEGGTFEMGDELGVGYASEQPVHSVTLKSFSIAKTETTVFQWKTYCNATGHSMPEAPKWGWRDDHPIVNVSWDDAVAYCDWLSDKTGNIYRLPTEAEWEYAARGGKLSKGYKYSGGQSIENVGWYNDNSKSETTDPEHYYSRPHAVAQKKPNELGIYDMSGNVQEWCMDFYGDYDASAQTNPRGSKFGDYRIARGGFAYLNSKNCRVASRNYGGGVAESFGGFRVVLTQ